jgi:hypothetical protein
VVVKWSGQSGAPPIELREEPSPTCQTGCQYARLA